MKNNNFCFFESPYCSPMIDPPKSFNVVDLILYVYNLLCSIYQSQLNWFVFNELYWSTPIHG